MWSFFSRDPSKDFPYDVGELIASSPEETIWSLHKGKKKVRFLVSLLYHTFLSLKSALLADTEFCFKE